MTIFFGKRGAGVLVQAADTGRVLFGLRSGEVNEPYTWGLWGGKIEDGERPDVGALREFREETGYEGPTRRLVPLLVYRRQGFTYRNYLLSVPHEFQPELGWENDDAVWAKIEDAPQPLHFGLEALLADEKSRRVIELGGQPPRRRNPVRDGLYHVTFAARLASIAEDGLVPGYRPSFQGFASYAKGWVFLCDAASVAGWFHWFVQIGEAESDHPASEGWIPVVLRVTMPLVVQPDPEGTRDVPEGESYRTPDEVSPLDLEVWDGAAWAPLDEAMDRIDPFAGVTLDQDVDDESGETIELQWVDDAERSRLFPPDLRR
jgi:8-oxo-dGTP diphosphatase